MLNFKLLEEIKEEYYYIHERKNLWKLLNFYQN